MPCKLVCLGTTRLGHLVCADGLQLTFERGESCGQNVISSKRRRSVSMLNLSLRQCGITPAVVSHSRAITMDISQVRQMGVVETS